MHPMFPPRLLASPFEEKVEGKPGAFRPLEWKKWSYLIIEEQFPDHAKAEEFDTKEWTKILMVVRNEKMLEKEPRFRKKVEKMRI